MRDGIPSQARSQPMPIAACDGPTGNASADAIAAKIEELRRSYGPILDEASDIIYTHDLNGDFLGMNARGEEILGYSPAEIVQMNIADILPADQLEIAIDKMRTKVDGAGPTTYEIDVVSKSGETIPLEVSTRGILAEGSVVAIQGIARDVRERRAARDQLAASERRFRGLVEHSGDVKMLLEPDGTIKYVSPGGERVLGIPAEALSERSVLELLRVDDVSKAREVLSSVRGSAEGTRGEVLVRDATAAERWLAFTAYDAMSEPAIGAIVVNFFDVTDRKRNEEKLIELANFQEALINLVEESLQEGLTEAFYSRVLRCAVDVISGAQAGSLMLKQSDGRCVFVAAEGFDLEELQKTYLYERELHRDHTKPGLQIVTGFQRSNIEESKRSGILFGAGKAADIAVTLSIPIELEGEYVAYFHLDNFDDPAAFTEEAVSMGRAFSNHIGTLLQRFRLEADLRQERAALDTMAYTDALTGLPNRNMFYHTARDMLEDFRAHAPVAVLFCDLDAFKQVNDTFGHPFGDRLLEAAAQRLLGCVRERDTVSRWGGDEFVLLLPKVRSLAAVEELADRIIERLNAPFAIDDEMVRIGCSIGIAVTSRPDASIDELTRQADVALYRAKEAGRNCHRTYSEGVEEDAADGAIGRMAIERDAVAAVREGRVALDLVPRLDLATGVQTASVARWTWQHPEHGDLSSDALRALADREGLATQLFERLLAKSCERLADAGAKRIAIEMWPALLRSEELPAWVRQAIASCGLEPTEVEWVMPASAVAQRSTVISGLAEHLSSQGFRISLAGFGAASPPLAYLADMPIHALVVDAGLVRALAAERPEPAQRTLRAIAALGRELGVEVVADGVESAIVAERLAGASIQLVQGSWRADQEGRGGTMEAQP